MKSKIKTVLLSATLMLMGTTITCCESDGKYQEFVYPEPTIDTITPNRGYTGSQFVIRGNNFGNRLEPVTVFFGNVEATVLSCKNDMIVVTVPEGAVSSDVSLKIWQYEYNSVGYYTVVDKPTVLDIATDNPVHPLFGEAGDVVTISGTSFGTEMSDVSVTIGLVDAKVLSVSDEEIKAEVPAGYGYGYVLVDVNGYEAKGGRLIDPSHVGDITSYAMQNYGQPFESTADAGVASWYIPTGWQFSDGCYMVQDNELVLMRPMLLEPNGNYKNGCIGLLCNQWSDVYHKNGYDNAKVFQTAFLPAGTYEMTVEVSECVLLAGTLEVFGGISKGIGTLPNIAGAEGVAGWSIVDESVLFSDGNGGKSCLRLTDDKNVAYDVERGSVPMSFTAQIDEASDVTIGFFGTVLMSGGRQGGDILMTKFKVERIY